MTGDSENEVGQSEDLAPPLTGESSPPPGEEIQPEREPARPRPFRSWASAAQEDKGPGLFGKLKQRLSGAFSKKAAKEAPAEPELIMPDEPEVVASETNDLQFVNEDTELTTGSAPDDAIFIQPPAEDPPMIEAAEVEEVAEVDEIVEIEDVVAASETGAAFASVEDALPADDLPLIEELAPEPEPAKKEKKPGLFGRLFGRKKKVEEPVEEIVAVEADNLDAATAAASALEMAAEAEFPPTEEAATFAHDETLDATVPMDVSSIDATMPMDTPSLDASTMPMDLPMLDTSEPSAPEAPAPEIETPVAESPREKRPSFIGRLFGKKPAPRPSLEIEIHADRIEAAAQAEHPALDDATQPMVLDEVMPPADDMRFAPPPMAAEPEPPPVAESRPTLEVGTGPTMEIEHMEFESPADSRPTMEVVPDSRPTMEVVPDSRPTMEVEPQQEGRSTLEFEQPAEVAEAIVDVDTDEFEIVTPTPSPPEAPLAIPDAALDVDTKEVTKKSILATLFKRKKKEAVVSATGTVVEGAPNFLFSKFRAFYNEIIRFKHQKSEFSAGFSTAIVTDYTADLTPDAAAEAQSKKLAEMLELQTAEASWMGGEALQYFPDAKYAMAALADELFTHMEWEGQEAWPRHLVEMRLFHTHAADVEVFKRMDKLLKDRPNSPAARDMARVYLLVLAAGFQGKWRPFELPRAIANYRQNLFEYIHATDPLMIYAPERRIFPEAAERTLVGHAVARFSGAQRWAAILFFLVTAYTVIAHVAWNRVSADLKDVTARIRSGSTSAGGDVR